MRYDHLDMLPERAFQPHSKYGMTLEGGGGGPSSTTTTTSGLNAALEPAALNLIAGAIPEYFNVDSASNITGVKPYTPYSTRAQDYVAGFSPQQEAVFREAAAMQRPGQFQDATQLAGMAGMGGLRSAQDANMYGSDGFQSGMLGQGLGVQGGQAYGSAGFQSGMAGQNLGMSAADVAAMQAAQAQNASYGYGAQGQAAGMRGENIGGMGAQQASSRANLATDIAMQSAMMGQAAGTLGQQLGIQGGQRFGEMGAGYGAQGAGYGAQAAALANQAQMYGGMGAGYGGRAANIGEMALAAQDYGRDVGEEARQFARQAALTGQGYAAQATDPFSVQRYMSPYMESVVQNQEDAARRNAAIQRQELRSQATRAGAFGGGREAVQRAEADRALNTQLDTIRAQGLQSAYDRAMQSLQYGAGQGIQGLQAAQSGLGTALQGGQLGLSGIGQAIAGQQAGISGAGMGLQGLGQAGQLYGVGIQGAQTGIQGAQAGLAGIDRQLAGTAQGMQGAQFGLSAADRALAAGQLEQQGIQSALAGTGQSMQGAGLGLQGVGQAINAGQLGLQGAGVGLQGTAQGMQGAQVGLSGVDRALAGTAQGMQGAQVGLQGVTGAQAGYGLAGQAGTNLANIGTAQQAADLSRMGFQSQMGAAQQDREQQIINQAVQNYAMAQENPFQRMSQYSGLIRGYMTPTTTVSQYSAAPSMGSQIGGLAAAAYGASQKKKGGRIKEGGIERLALRRALKGGRA